MYNGESVFIPLSKIKSYMTVEFNLCYYVYWMTETTGQFPFSGGWAEQPEWIAQAISTLKSEHNKYESETYEKQRSSR